jgi:hypothetical protein
MMAAAMAEVDGAEEEDAYDMSGGLATATFTEAGSLGMRFTPNKRTGAVEILGLTKGGQASRFPQIRVGMMLTAVGNQSIAGMPYADVIAMIKMQGRPVTMVFAEGAGGGGGNGGGLAPAPAPAPAPPPEPTGQAAAIALQAEIMKNGTGNVKKIDRLRRASLQPDRAPGPAPAAVPVAAPPPAQMSEADMMAAAMAEVDGKPTGQAAAMALQQEIMKNGTSNVKKIDRLRRASLEGAPPPPPPEDSDDNDPPPPPPPSEEPVINAAGSAVQQTVEALYKRYNPAKVPEVPTLIKKYGEDDLLRMVRKKYAKQEKKRQKEVIALGKWLKERGLAIDVQKAVIAFDNANFKSAEWIPTLQNMPPADMEEFVAALVAQ